MRHPVPTAIFGAVLVWGTAASQAYMLHEPDSLRSAPDSLHSKVIITATVDSALVVLDAVPVGHAPFATDTLRPGRHVIRVFHPDLSSWLAGSITDTVDLHPGESRTLHYRVCSHLLIVSSPSGAHVFRGESLLGTTPLLLSPDSLETPLWLTVQKEGYEPMRLNPADASRGILAATLKKMWTAAGVDSSEDDQPQGARSSLGAYVSGAAAVVSGAAAAYFKIKADERYDAFRRSGNSSFQEDTTHLDRAAAISLVAAQVSLGLFAYFLLRE